MGLRGEKRSKLFRHKNINILHEREENIDRREYKLPFPFVFAYFHDFAFRMCWLSSSPLYVSCNFPFFLPFMSWNRNLNNLAWMRTVKEYEISLSRSFAVRCHYIYIFKTEAEKNYRKFAAKWKHDQQESLFFCWCSWADYFGSRWMKKS